MASYGVKIKSDIERWTAEGLIDGATAQKMLVDVEQRDRRSINFGAVLAIMAAVLVGAAILTFIAANWEGLPRLARVGALFGVILASYLGGAVLKGRDNAALGEALYLLGAITFGASIALIGQMYHFSGDETKAVLVWCLGTALAAVGLRSPVLTTASVLLAVAWLVMCSLGWEGRQSFPHLFLAIGAGIWGISYWTGSRAARHLLLLSLILYIVLFGLDAIAHGYATPIEVGSGLALVSAIVFLAAYFAHDAVERFAQLGGPYPVHPLIGFLFGIAMVQGEVLEQFSSMFIATMVAFAGIVAALLLRGRESALMRWVAYAAFIIELGFLYLVTLGTLMDTSALFLLSGLALAATACLIIYFEKRMKARHADLGGKA